MKSSSAKKVVAIYSIVFATLSLLGTFTETPDVLGIIIVITMLISGIILLIPELKKVEKPLMITLLVVYSVFVLGGLIYFFIIPLIGLIVFGMVGVPFIFAIVFLSLKAKEDNHVTSQSSNPPFFSSSQDRPFATNYFSSPATEDQCYTKLSSYNKMLKEGLITQEEFDQKKKEILGL